MIYSFVNKAFVAVKPNMVEIMNKPATLSSERYVNLVCVSEGSRPPAQLTWYKDNRKFKSSRVKVRVTKVELP